MLRALLSVVAICFVMSSAQANDWKDVSYSEMREIAERTIEGFGAKIDTGRKVILNKKNLKQSKEARQNDLAKGVYFAAKPLRQSSTELKIIETLLISSKASASGETESYRATYFMTRPGQWSGNWKVKN